MRRREFLMGCLGAMVMANPSETQRGGQPLWTEEDEALLAGAKERIAKIRRREVVLLVRRPDGKPAAGAQISLRQRRHRFLFGCNLFRWGRIPHPEREEAYRQRFAALLNYATLGFYWASYEREQGKPAYDYTDAVVAWCQEQGIVAKGHPLVWDHMAGSPAWLPQDTREIEALSKARVRDIVSRFAGRIDRWDVVNEPTDLGRFPTTMNRLARELGPVAYTALHLRVAREANPKATLLVNDYRVDAAFLGILQQLRDEQGNLLFDVVGLQSHMHGGPWPPRRVWEVCQRFAVLGVPLHFTETTIVSGPWLGNRWGPTTPEGEEQQAEATVRFYTMLFSHPAVEAITWWDFSDDGAWQGAAAGWLRRDMSPKPVYERLMGLIKGEWWTQAEGVADKEGRWSIQATLGEYDLTVHTPDGRSHRQSLQVAKGPEEPIEVPLP